MALSTGSVAALIALAALVGVGVAIAQPAEFALVPVAAGGRRLSEVNGLVETARYAGATLGPPLGGVLAATGRIDIALWVDAATFLAVAAAAAAAARPPPAASSPRATARSPARGSRR